MPTFDTPEPISVTLALLVGDARITASDRTNTVVEVSPTDPSDKADRAAAEHTRIDYSRGVLLVRAPKRHRPFAPVGSINVRIELPAGSRLQGDASMADLHSEGRLGECRFGTATGNIQLDETGRLHAKTNLGAITVDRAESHAEVTGSGEVRVREIDGTAVIKNLNGDTWVGEITGDLRCSAANGHIAVDRAGATVGAKTANGTVRIGEVAHGSVVLESGFGELEVGIREGTAALLDVRSRFGSVHNSLDAAEGPQPSDETVEVRARTSYGDIVVRRSRPASPLPN